MDPLILEATPVKAQSHGLPTALVGMIGLGLAGMYRKLTEMGLDVPALISLIGSLAAFGHMLLMWLVRGAPIAGAAFRALNEQARAWVEMCLRNRRPSGKD
jgi:hypothetical protein